MMSSSPRQQQQLHVYFFSLMAPGHMIPVVDMARQFARHDPSVKATIVLPHLNAPQFEASVERDRRNHGSSIRIVPVTFPTAQVGLPDDCASLASITSPDMHSKFQAAVDMLRSPSEHLLRLDPPDCIVSDFFIPWTAALAAHLRVPRIIVHVSGFFPLCVHHSLTTNNDWRRDEDDVILVPGLPDDVTMTRRQLGSFSRFKDPDEISIQIIETAKEAERSSYGAVFNTFEELEPRYADHYKKNICSKVWHVGPASLSNTDPADKAQRGGGGGGGDCCLDWLSTKEPESVIYVCFGTMSLFSAAQVREIAAGLESCGRGFVWAIKNGNQSLLPEGFEERVGGRGLVLKSWAPQLSILEHGSVGGFLTHCGWNSLMEGVCAGKPMVTWPISSEQFENEKLLTDVLKIGVGVGCAEWSDRLDVGRGLIKGEDLSKAVNRVMVGEERVEMKKRVMELGEQARKAVEKGGSSYNDLDSLLGELRSIKDGKINVVV